MVSAPFWGSRIVPVLIRVWFAILLAVASHPVIGAVKLNNDITVVYIIIALSCEFGVGLGLGWTAQILFAGMRLAGEEIELKTGLGLIQLTDPNGNGQSGVFSSLLEVIAGLIFFSINGHHLLVKAIWSSYQVFPLAGEKFGREVLDAMIFSSMEIFLIALRVSAPVVVGLMLSDIILGLIGRAVPQMNVFMVAQPLQFALAVILLFLAVPSFVWFFMRHLAGLTVVPGFPA